MTVPDLPNSPDLPDAPPAARAPDPNALTLTLANTADAASGKSAAGLTAAELFVRAESPGEVPAASTRQAEGVLPAAPGADARALARRMSPLARSLLLGAGAVRLTGRAPVIVLEVELTWCVLQRGVRPGNIPAMVASECRRRLCGVVAAFLLHASLIAAGFAALITASSAADFLLGGALLAAQVVLGGQLRRQADRLRLSVLECSLADMQSLRSQVVAARQRPPSP